jgi:hypothetical protein
MDNDSYINLCETVKFLSESKLLWTLNILRFALAIIGTILCAIMFRIQGKYFSFHPNARLLLLSHNLWAMTQSLGQLILHSFDLVRFGEVDDENPCEYLVTTLVSVSQPSVIEHTNRLQEHFWGKC